MRRKEKRCFSFSAILFITSLMSTLVFADIDPNGPYGIAPEQITNYTANSINSLGMVYAAGTYGASTTLTYSSYIFTTEDIVLFGYEDGTQLEVYDPNGNSISFTPDVLDEG